MEPMGDLEERAAELWDECFHDPRRVLVAVGSVVAEALAEGDIQAACAALRAHGMAHRALRNPTLALPPLDRAVELSRQHGRPDISVLPLVTRAGAQLSVGRRDAALADIGEAESIAQGKTLGPVLVQKAIIHLRLGQPEEALRSSSKAIRQLRRGDDGQSLATALMNRGLTRAYRGETKRARADLLSAVERYEAAGDGVQAATAIHNLGFVDLCSGDIPGALTRFDEAGQKLTELGVSAVEIDLDRCDALLQAGLAGEARQDALAVARELGERSMTVELGEALLLAARAGAVDGDLVTAWDHAAEAKRVFERCGRPRWAAHADLVLTEITVKRGGGDIGTAKELVEIAIRLDSAGLALGASHAWLAAGRHAMGSGDADQASMCLGRVSGLRRSRSIQLRLLGWTAEAFLRAGGLRPQSTERAIQAGVAALEEITSLLGTYELEAATALTARDLLALGLDRAVEAGRLDRIFRWVERARGRSFRQTPELSDEQLASDLAQWRALTRVLNEGDELAKPALTKLVDRAERRVRDRARRQPGRSRPLSNSVDLATVSDALEADETFVQMYEHGDQLRAVVVASGSVSHVHLADLGEVHHARRRLAATMRDAMLFPEEHTDYRLLARSADQLGGLLARPLEKRVSGGWVISPPTTLHDLPWRMLPMLRSTRITVAPSATIWVRARTATRNRGGRRVFAAGPGLEGVDEEVELLSQLYDGADALRGESATVGSVMVAADGAQMVHLAAHGLFRADNPLFSEILLSDGSLTGYDVQRLETPPQLVVLANCESARSRPYPGDEMVGVAAALLRLGTSTVIASVLPVSDLHTVEVMRRLHEALRSGASPADALLRAAEASWERSPAVTATVGAFVVIGSGT